MRRFFSPDGSPLERFWSVEGLPVKTVGFDAWAFDADPPRTFPATSVERNGAELTADEFDALVAEERARKDSSAAA